jgi:UDP-N-acetylglucosamine acyltransferase
MNNFIHPTSIIGENVILGKGNHIGPFCYITGETIIGDNNVFEAYSSIGTSAEHNDYFLKKPEKLIIGSNNIFREFTTVNAGTKDTTTIYGNVKMLRGSHIGHDCIIHDNVTLSCNSIIGGHSILMKGVNFGLGSICHQFSKIGAYAMIGMGGIVTKKSTISPFGIYVGNPVKFIKENIVGIERNNISSEDIINFKKEYEKL